MWKTNNDIDIKQTQFDIFCLIFDQLAALEPYRLNIY